MDNKEIEILKNLIEYLQNQIDNGYHKFIYNDLNWDFKCVDGINVLNKAIELLKENKELIIKANDLKQENEYLNCIIQSDKDNYINKNLIKQKINEYEYKLKDFELTDNSGRFKKENSIDYYKIEVLKELMED